MARIPEEEVDRIKREVSIVSLVESRGVKLTGHGDNLIGLCPLHDDHTPSLVVSPAKGVWHCLGACQTGGSVIDWVMKTDRVSFRLAVEMLRKKAPSLVAQRPHTRAKLDELAEPHDPDRVVLRRVVDFYHETLKQSPEAHAYLERRGLYSPELVETFRLGYSNRTLASRLPEKQVKAGEAIRTQLQRLGVLRGSGHEHLAGSIVIPIFSDDGEVLELYGRKVRSNLLLRRNLAEVPGLIPRPAL